jgi:hypothetical protein
MKTQKSQDEEHRYRALPIIVGIFIIALLLIYFVVPGYTIGIILKIQGWKKGDAKQTWVKYVFSPTFYVADKLPKVGRFYNGQAESILE